MDLDDFVPTGGGSLRDSLRPRATRQPVATFTTPTLNHDEIWESALRGGEHERDRPKRTRPQQDRLKAHAEQPPHEETARMIRAALRPGG
jgi:hypothetical protein